MNKIIVISLLFSIVFSLTSLSYLVNAQVAIGSRSEEVKTIQDILKTDPSIYPQGLVTGYYGSLTQDAVKRLQKRCGLPETGIIDDATEKCIYPIDYKVTVVSPNGGEVWDRNTIQTVKWDITTPPGIAEVPPLWPKASIDLFKRVSNACRLPEGCPTETETTTSVFVKHLVMVNLFDKAYSGRITSDIPNGKDYVIRISVGKNITGIWKSEKNQENLPSAAEIWPITPPVGTISWDESDGTFEITGTTTPTCPTCPVCPNQDDVIASLTQIIEQLQRIIALLKSK